MSNLGRFVKSSAVYFAGNVLTKVISFLLIPIYTNYLTTVDMGYYDTSFAYLNILTPVISLEIWSAMMRYMYDYTDTKLKYKPIVNGFCIFGVSALIYSGIFIVLSFRDIKYLPLLYLYGLLAMLHSIYSYVSRGLGLNKLFAISGIIGSLVASISNIVMILGFGMKIDSLYIAAILGLFVQLIIMNSKVQLFRNFKREYIDKTLIKSMLIFGLPLCLNSTCFWFLSNYNIIAIKSILGLSANGVYGICARFSTVLALVSTCFSMAWQELVYSKGNEKDKSEFYTTATNYYIKFLMFGILLFMPAIQVIFPYFIGSEYQGAFEFIPLYLLATAASIISGFFGNIFSAEKKTGVIFISTVVAAIVNVSVLHLTIGKLGLQAANLSLFLGFIVNIIIRILLLRKTSKIIIDYITLFGLIILFTIGWWVYLNLNLWWNILFAVVVVIVGLLVFKDLIKNVLKMTMQKLNNRNINKI